jgi:HNH endonuclease
MPFQVDHIIAEKHGGETVVSNLALACPHCNLYKGPNIAGLDPASGQVVRLFHPRTDVWSEHFAWEEAYLTGRSPIGRVTVQVLAMNAEDFRQFRVGLWKEGNFAR